ncbi:HD domain-containing protein [Patescibacteria group bacterium]|nr:HD domain-containing protein [Patescibacteria group bacterium]
MEIKEIIRLVGQRQPKANTEIIGKTYQFFRNELEELPFSDNKSYLSSSLERAFNAANEDASVELICASILFDLVKTGHTRPKILQKELGNDIELLTRVYEFARQKLENEYLLKLQHSLRSAIIASKINIGPAIICATLLHEIIPYTDTSIDEIRKNFGDEITELVANYNKIHGIQIGHQQYLTHLREMVIALAKDLRVIIIRICSNIDSLQTSSGTSDKIKSLARESLEVLGPISDLMGIWSLRWPIEDLSFKILYPEEFEKIELRFNSDERKNREKYIQKTKNILLKLAKSADIQCDIGGRFKHYYSIHQKMKRKGKIFYEIGDIFALRIIVNSVDDCYRILGVIHQQWRPKQKRIKDYIASPKNNNYRSLHTTVYGLNGRPTEFQIRTPEMDEEANFGIAAHWYYKNTKRKKPFWINDLLQRQQQCKDDEEFLKTFSAEILQDRIYVYTPKGDVISLPAGSTPVDFAYRIHSEVGNKCAEAFVNDMPVQLNHELATYDTVRIITDRKQAGPKYEWLNFVKSNAARKHIELFFNQRPVERFFRL